MALALRQHGHHVFDPTDPLCYQHGGPTTPTAPGERKQALAQADALIGILPGSAETAALLGLAQAQQKYCAMVGLPGPGEWSFCQLWPSLLMLENDTEIAGQVDRWAAAKRAKPRRTWRWPWAHE